MTCREKARQSVELVLKCKFNEDVDFSTKDSEKINDSIINALNDCLEGEFDSGYEPQDDYEYEGGLYEDESYEQDEKADIEFWVNYNDLRIVTYGTYDPGCMYMSNGDPGYPPEFNEDSCQGYIERVNRKVLEEKLKALPEIGKYIEDIAVKVDDYDSYGSPEWDSDDDYDGPDRWED